MTHLYTKLGELAARGRRGEGCLKIEICVANAGNPFETKINEALAAAHEGELPDLFYSLFHYWLGATQTAAAKDSDADLLREASRIFGPAFGRCHCGKRGGMIVTMTANGKNLAVWQDMPGHIAADEMKDDAAKPVFAISSSNGRSLDRYLDAISGIAATHFGHEYFLYLVPLPKGGKLFIKIANPY